MHAASFQQTMHRALLRYEVGILMLALSANFNQIVAEIDEPNSRRLQIFDFLICNFIV